MLTAQGHHYDLEEIYAIEYLLFHEMLHLKHPVQMRNGRRCVHSREFQRKEKMFPEMEKVKEYLKTV